MNHPNRVVWPSVLLGLGLAVALAIAPAALAAPEEDPRTLPAAAEAAPYTVQTELAPIKIGATGKATIRIKPATGFKWNKLYPAKLTFDEPPALVALPKTRFHQLKGDFQATDKEGGVEVPVQAKALGKAPLKGQAKFSVCDEVKCLIESHEIVLAVEVVE